MNEKLIREAQEELIVAWGCIKSAQNKIAKLLDLTPPHEALASLDDEKAEYCEWAQDEIHEKYATTGCTGDRYYTVGFKFCPFCGKPIRIKEPS